MCDRTLDCQLPQSPMTKVTFPPVSLVYLSAARTMTSPLWSRGFTAGRNTVMSQSPANAVDESAMSAPITTAKTLLLFISPSYSKLVEKNHFIFIQFNIYLNRRISLLLHQPTRPVRVMLSVKYFCEKMYRMSIGMITTKHDASRMLFWLNARSSALMFWLSNCRRSCRSVTFTESGYSSVKNMTER